MQKTKENFGITLISLVITIIVLLIISGISMAFLLTKNGILSKTQDSKNAIELSQLKEELITYKLGYLDKEINLDSVDINTILPSLSHSKYKNSIKIKNNKIQIDSKNINLSDNEKAFIYNNLETFYLITYATSNQYSVEIKDEEEKTCIITAIYETAIRDNKLILPDYIDFGNTTYKVVENTTDIAKNLNFTYIFIPETFTAFSRLGSSNTLEEVFFSEGTTTLNYGSFSNSENLHTVHLPNSLKIIHGSVFANCINLKSLVIPNSVITIDEQVFMGSGLITVILPDSITSMGDQLFQDCQHLEYVQFPKHIKILPYSTFINTYCKSFKLPDDLIEISDSSLKCGIPSIEIPDGVKKLGNNLFDYKTINIRVPNSVENFGDFLYNISDGEGIVVYTDNQLIIDYLKTTKATIKPYSDWNV